MCGNRTGSRSGLECPTGGLRSSGRLPPPERPGGGRHLPWKSSVYLSSEPCDARVSLSCSSPPAPTSPPKTTTGSAVHCAPSATTASDGSRVRGRLTALMWVAWCGDIDAAAALIFAGADTTSTNHRGYAAHLHARCVWRNKRAYMGRETAETMARENRKLAEYTEAVHRAIEALHRAMLRAAESGDIPRLQVLRCVLGPIRALAAELPTLAAGAAATWRRCRASRPVR